MFRTRKVHSSRRYIWKDCIELNQDFGLILFERREDRIEGIAWWFGKLFVICTHSEAPMHTAECLEAAPEDRFIQFFVE